MARRPDTPCAHCGTLLYTAKTSLPPGMRTCRACRRANAKPKPATRPACSATGCATRPRGSNRCGKHREPMRAPKHACPVCGALYRLSYGGQRTCGRVCGQRLRRGAPEPEACAVWIKDCSTCTRAFVARRHNQVTCSKACRQAHVSATSLAWMNANYERMRHRIADQAHRRRARLAGQTVERVDPQYVYERDGWRCAICKRKVRRAPRYQRDPEMASLDHVVPLVEGGEHSYANTRCTHYRCNLARGARGGAEQLALI